MPIVDPWDTREAQFAEHPVRGTLKTVTIGWIIALAVIALVLVTSVLLWGLGVFTSDIKGRGDAKIIKNSAPNRIAAQEQFETRYQAIMAADRNITLTQIALTTAPTDTKLQTELLGQEQYCVGLVGSYNADSRKFTREDFRAADLPFAIDNNDRTTDCKGN